MKSERRRFIKNLGVGAVGMTMLPSAIACDPKEAKKVPVSIPKNEKKIPNELQKYSRKALDLVNTATSIDMLGTYQDWFHERAGKRLGEYWLTEPNAFTQEDYEFVKSSGINVFGWGSMQPTHEAMLQFMATQNGIIASNPTYFERIDTKQKLENINASEKIGMLITNQNSSHFRTVDDVDLFYGLGQRVSQLTYNGKNKLGCGAFEDEDTGLTAYGEEILLRMNAVGMGVDVSHCGDQTTLDAIAASTAPVLITHGACRSIAKGLRRSKTDEAIKAMAKTGGVIGIPILRFMVKEKEPVTIEDFFKHIDHVVQLVGIEHVGIGSDQGLYTEDYGALEWRKNRLENAPAKYQTHTNEEYMLTIEGLNHPYRTYDIAEGLLKRGYKDSEVKMVLGDNFKRVLTTIFKH